MAAMILKAVRAMTCSLAAQATTTSTAHGH